MPRFPPRIKCLKIPVRQKTYLAPLLLIILSEAIRQPARNCLGYRPYDKETKTYGPYEWLSYATVQRRRGNFGVGIIEVNRRAGNLQSKYGVGLWCQNRPEWQLTGTTGDYFAYISPIQADKNPPRFGLHVTVAIHGVYL